MKGKLKLIMSCSRNVDMIYWRLRSDGNQYVSLSINYKCITIYNTHTKLCYTKPIVFTTKSFSYFLQIFFFFLLKAKSAAFTSIKAMCHTDAPLWSAREIASMAHPAEQERHAKNVWHIALRRCVIPTL